MSRPKNPQTPNMEEALGKMIPAVYVIGCGVLLTYVLAMILFKNEISKNPSDWGVLGDYFGGLMNPVTSFATLMVAYAVWRQQKKELRQTKETLEEQAKTAELQRREQRFFDLLNVYYRTIESLRFDQETGQSNKFKQATHVSLHGKDAIQGWLSSGGNLWAFTQEKGDYVKVAQPFAPGTCLADLKKSWDEGGSHFFGAYLRTMSLILSNATTLLKEDHRTYTELLKAQLSNGELVLIGYHLLFDQRKSGEFIAHAKRYELLSNLMPGDLHSALKDNLPFEIFGSTANGHS